MPSFTAHPSPPAKRPESAPGGSGLQGGPSHRTHRPLLSGPPIRWECAGGREEGQRLQEACDLTHLRRPQARVGWARDNGTPAENTPRVSIQGCLLPTLATPRDPGGETGGWECQTVVRALRWDCVRALEAEGCRALAQRSEDDLATFPGRGRGRGGRY